MVYENLINFIGSPWFYLLLIWSAVWKGIALWKAGRNNHIVWFIFLFIINSAGILPIIYLILYKKRRKFKKK